MASIELATSSNHVEERTKSLTVPRASMACTSCRRLKIRCVRPTASDCCEYCAETRRQCQFVPQTRTRRRDHTGERLNELEQQVQSLIKMKQVPNESTPMTTDIVSQVGWEVARKLFDRYRTELVPCYPIVPLDNVSIEDCRREQPVLFLAIITAAAATSSEETQDLLYATIVKEFAIRILVEGQKSLELLQALLITVAWYRPCHSFGDTKYLQYSQLASMMTHELELHRDRLSGDYEIARRTLLASYLQTSSKELMSGANFMASSPSLVTAYLTECEVKLLDATTHDQSIISYARIQHNTQQALELLHNKNSFLNRYECDSESVMSILSVYGELILSQPTNSAFLRVAAHAAVLRLYEIVLYGEYDAQDFRAPFVLDTRPRTGSIPLIYLEPIYKCITTALELLTVITTMDVKRAAAVPPVMFVRMMHAFVVLWKIHQLVSLSAVEDVQLPWQLEKMHRMLSDLNRYTNVSGANKFLSFIEAIQECIARG